MAGDVDSASGALLRSFAHGPYLRGLAPTAPTRRVARDLRFSFSQERGQRRADVGGYRRFPGTAALDEDVAQLTLGRETGFRLDRDLGDH